MVNPRLLVHPSYFIDISRRESLQMGINPNAKISQNGALSMDFGTFLLLDALN